MSHQGNRLDMWRLGGKSDLTNGACGYLYLWGSSRYHDGILELDSGGRVSVIDCESFSCWPQEVTTNIPFVDCEFYSSDSFCVESWSFLPYF